jgi:hypothetical protein
MSSNKKRSADAIAAAEAKVAAAQAAQTEAEAKLAAAQSAQTEALTELAIAQTKILRLSSTDMDIVAEDHTAPGVGSGSSAPMDIVELAPRDPQCSLFDGASCESQKPLLKGHCTFCGRTFEHPSMVAYFLAEEGKPFAKVKQPVCEKVFGGRVVNVWGDREVFAGCAFCAQTWHKRDPPYVTEIVLDGRTSYKLTSEWTRLKNGSNGKPMSKHQASKMCQLHDMKTEPAEGALSSQQIYEKHFDHRVQQANDWVTELGGRMAFLFIFYGCTTCQVWTVGSNHWYRTQRRVAEMTDSSTTDGADVGSWRCCGCFGKWTWAEMGHRRLVVVGKASESGGFEPGYTFALIGGSASDPNADIVANKINFLKTATLLTELGGKTVDETALLGALEAMQRRVEKKFSKGMGEVSVEYSKPVPQHKLDEANVAIICQDPRLSMPSPGRRMLVIKQSPIEKNGKKVETIDPAELSVLLDIAASAYCIETAHVGKAATFTKAIKNLILSSEGFALGRAGIRSRM